MSEHQVHLLPPDLSSVSLFSIVQQMASFAAKDYETVRPSAGQMVVRVSVETEGNLGMRREKCFLAGVFCFHEFYSIALMLMLEK